MTAPADSTKQESLPASPSSPKRLKFDPAAAPPSTEINPDNEHDQPPPPNPPSSYPPQSSQPPPPQPQEFPPCADIQGYLKHTSAPLHPYLYLSAEERAQRGDYPIKACFLVPFSDVYQHMPENNMFLNLEFEKLQPKNMVQLYIEELQKWCVKQNQDQDQDQQGDVPQQQHHKENQNQNQDHNQDNDPTGKNQQQQQQQQEENQTQNHNENNDPSDMNDVNAHQAKKKRQHHKGHGHGGNRAPDPTDPLHQANIDTAKLHDVYTKSHFNHIKYDVMTRARKRTYAYDRYDAFLKNKAKTSDIEMKVPMPDNTGATQNQNGPIGPIVVNDKLDSEAALSANVEGLVKGKLFLAPLTTVGNLPFRRVCTDLGATMTCGEMAVATNILKGNPAEWALLRRHRSERFFGVQLAGNKPEILARTAELISKECNVDFVDLNSACPIDLFFNQGMGCDLMRKRSHLINIVRSMSSVIDCPLSIKLRMGVSDKNAHQLLPELKQHGLAWATVHGRTRVQRYSKSADWDYLENVCAPACKKAGLPLIGNGDIYHWKTAVELMEGDNFATVMLARGALQKPWLFTEIAERRDWDISSSERFDLYRRYVNYGLEHWGADKRGVENTRRFLLEWLSYLYRYVPVAMLEIMPPKLGYRAPQLCYRDHLEAMLASPEPKTWVKISELLLGPAPSGFKFTPKHKSSG